MERVKGLLLKYLFQINEFINYSSIFFIFLANKKNSHGILRKEPIKKRMESRVEYKKL